MKSATFALILLAALGHARAATLTVTSKADSGPGTLREALDLAASGDTITFGGGVFSAPSGPGSLRVVIRLTSGPLPLKPVILQGLANADGSNRVVITGDADASGTPTAGDVAIFSGTPSGAPAELTIERLNFEDTATPAGDPLISIDATSLTHLSLIRCRFINNGSIGTSAIVNLTGGSCDIDINNCTFKDNETGSLASLHISGGDEVTLFSTEFIDNISNSAVITNRAAGVLLANATSVLVNKCTFDGNQSNATASGLLMMNNSDATIERSLFHANESTHTSAPSGALRVYNFSAPLATALIRNCTFSANISASPGAGIVVRPGVVTLEHCTVTGNQSDRRTFATGGAVSADTGALIKFRASIIAANSDAHPNPASRVPDVGTSNSTFLSSLGQNVIGDITGSGTTFDIRGNRIGNAISPLDPGLLPLADNGGPTLTHGLHPLSVARDLVIGSSITLDQRDFPRPSGEDPDSGAFEAQLQTFSDWAAERLSSFPISERQVLDDPDEDGLSNGYEFLQGSAPGLAGSRFDRIESVNGLPQYSFTLSNSADFTSIEAALEVSPDLQFWRRHFFDSKTLFSGAQIENSNAERTRFVLPYETFDNLLELPLGETARSTFFRLHASPGTSGGGNN